MGEDDCVLQKVEWYQVRRGSGEATLVMVASLPNGFFTATPVDLGIVHADHSLIGLGATAEDALAMARSNIAEKTHAELFPARR